MSDNKKTDKPKWVEEIEIAGDNLVAKVKELIKEGNIRRLIIRNSDGDILVEIPLSAGIAVGGITTIFMPILVALGAMASMIASFKVEVIRRPEQDKK